jgi:cation transporter-like permease
MLVANSVIWALLVVAVIAHVVAAAEFFRYLWTDVNHGLALFAACAVTVFWVTWLRAFEFHRAYPKREDHNPPDIFRRPLR